MTIYAETKTKNAAIIWLLHVRSEEGISIMNRLLFVCGFPGGGTDLIKTILNAHPDIHINGEMPFLKNIGTRGYDRNTKFADIRDIVAFQRTLKNLDTWNNIENIDHDFSAEIVAKGQLTLEEVLRVCFSKNSYRVWGNKTPQNTESVELLLNLFPRARFLIVTRDVRDVCLSWRNKWGKDMTWCSAKWAKRMRRGWNVTSNISQKRYLYLKYEDILSDTEVYCKRVCEFLEIPFSERMLEHHKYTTETVEGKINYGRRIEREHKDKWKDQLPRGAVIRIEEIAFTTMNIFDYQVEFASAEKRILLREILKGVWNDFLALILIGNRASGRNTVNQRIRTLIFEFKKQFLK